MNKSKTLQIRISSRRGLVIAAVATVAVVCLLLALLAEYGVIAAADYEAKAAFGTRTPSGLSWTEVTDPTEAVLENDRVQLVLDPATAHFTLTDRLTGQVYSSFSEAEDFPVTAQEIAEYRSVVSLAFLDTNAGEWQYMGSEEHSVKAQNFSLLYAKDRLRTVYHIGTSDTAYLVPLMMEKSFYETVILEKTTSRGKRRLSRYYTLYEAANPDEDYEAMKAQYPQLEEYDLYILNDTVGESDYDKIHEYITATGYTHEAYQEDMTALGVKVSASQKQSGFTVAVDYALCEDGVQVSVPLEELKVNREQDTLYSITLLNGGMSCPSAEGNYYLVPDGSGAVLETNRTAPAVYTQEMYGPDDNRKEEKQVQLTEQLTLPCFGMKRGDGGLLAVIEEGAAATTLSATLVGTEPGNNRLYATFIYRPYIRSSIGNDRGMEDVYLFAQEPLSRNPSMQLMVLSEENNTYSGMARRYRQYLQETGVLPAEALTANALPLYADFLGSVRQQTNTLGITHSRTIALSYLEDIQAITEALQKQGVQTVRLRLKGFDEEGLEGSVADGFRLNTRLGSTAMLQTLADTLTAGGGALSLHTELSTVYRNRAFDGFDTHVDTVRTLDRKIGSLVAVYDAVTQQPAFSLGTGYLVTPRLYPKLTAGLAKDLDEKYRDVFTDISWGQAGYRLYSDYNRQMEVDRTYAAALLQEGLATLAGQRTVTVDYGFGYTLSSASHIVDMPLTCSEFTAESYGVPFYPMVVHGLVSYSGCALNTTTSLAEQLLLCAETGAAPYHTWMTESSLLLRDTRFDKSWYALNGADDVERVAQSYATLNGLLQPVLGAQLTEHSRTGEIAVSTYANGYRVLVNYSAEETIVDGVSIPAKGAVTLSGTTVVYTGSF